MRMVTTCPQIRSTQTTGVPDWVLGSFVFVAHGIVIQSVEHWGGTVKGWSGLKQWLWFWRWTLITEVPTTLPRAGEPPVTEKDCAGLLAGEQKTMVADCSWFIFHLKYVQALLIITEHLCQDKQCTESHRSSFPSSHTQCSQCWTAGGPGEW